MLCKLPMLAIITWQKSIISIIFIPFSWSMYVLTVLNAFGYCAVICTVHSEDSTFFIVSFSFEFLLLLLLWILVENFGIHTKLKQFISVLTIDRYRDSSFSIMTEYNGNKNYYANTTNNNLQTSLITSH